jgi:hypothetical protein
MKKINVLLIIFALILSACASTQEVIYSGQKSGKIRVGASKQDVRSAFLSGGLANDPWIGECGYKWFPKTKMEIIYSQETQDVFLVFENVTSQQRYASGTGVSGKYCYTSEWNIGNGTLKAWVPTLAAAEQIATGTVSKKKQPVKQDLDTFKAMCRDIGYNEGTEKFADCVKDLYLKNAEVSNQNQTISNMTGTPKKKIDPSVWDDLGNISEDLLGGKSVSESLGGVSSSSGTRKITCFKTGEETGGLNKICRYDCVGNLVTTTVGAAEMCPIQIQR